MTDTTVDDPVKSFLAQQSEMMKSVLSSEEEAAPGSPEAQAALELKRVPSISHGDIDAVNQAEEMTKMMQETLLAISPTSGNVHANLADDGDEVDEDLDDIILLDEETGGIRLADDGAAYGAAYGGSGGAGGGGGGDDTKENGWFGKNKKIVLIVALLVIIGAVGGAVAATSGGSDAPDSSKSLPADGASDGTTTTTTGSIDPIPAAGTTASPTAAPTVQTFPPTISAQPTLTKQPSPAPTPCVPCTNLRANNMIVNDLYCDTYDRIFRRRCATDGSWWIDAPEPYCQYSCWEQGVGYDGYPCCEIEELAAYVPPPVEKEAGCVECSNARTEYMIETNRLCDSWDYVKTSQCNNVGSIWNTMDDPPCQYECWRWGKPYDNHQNCCREEYEPSFGLEPKAPNATAEVASDGPDAEQEEMAAQIEAEMAAQIEAEMAALIAEEEAAAPEEEEEEAPVEEVEAAPVEEVEAAPVEEVEAAPVEEEEAAPVEEVEAAP